MLSLQSKNRSNFHTIPKWIYIISSLAFFCSLPSASYFDISVGFYGKCRVLDDTNTTKENHLENIVTTQKYGKQSGKWKVLTSSDAMLHIWICELEKWKKKWNIKIHHVVWSERLNGNACACINQQNFLLHLPLRKMRWKSSETNCGLLSHHFHKTNIFFCWRFSFRIVSSAYATITFNCITTFVFHIFHAYFAHFIFHSARTVAIEVTVIALRLFKVDNIVDCHKITLNISACVRTELNFVITERGL